MSSVSPWFPVVLVPGNSACLDPLSSQPLGSAFGFTSFGFWVTRLWMVCLGNDLEVQKLVPGSAWGTSAPGPGFWGLQTLEPGSLGSIALASLISGALSQPLKPALSASSCAGQAW